MRCAAGAAGLALLLAGCATGPGPAVFDHEARAALEQRARLLDDWSRWGLTGRLSIDDGAEGGSGRLDWEVREEQSLLGFRGALGQGAWQLEIGPDGATLSKADGTVTRDASLDRLVRRETGWQVPVDALQWWVRGLPEPGHEYSASVSTTGVPVLLSQRGWRVQYRRYAEREPVNMPRLLEATDGEYRIKLAISRWWHTGDSAGG